MLKYCKDMKLFVKQVMLFERKCVTLHKNLFVMGKSNGFMSRTGKRELANKLMDFFIVNSERDFNVAGNNRVNSFSAYPVSYFQEVPFSHNYILTTSRSCALP